MRAGPTLPSCREIVEGLPEWVEGSLGELAPFQRHLVACPPCGNLARTYQALGAVARAALEVRMPLPARERLRRSILDRVLGG